jgi:aryl-alcohol dehydrogenase-like predicted oxidoreductase
MNHKDYLSRLALGTVQFGIDYGIANRRGQVSTEEVAEILRYAHSAGVNTLDTAISYGNSETVLGQVGVKYWRVVSKLPAVPKDTKDLQGWVEQSVHASLQRLNLSQLYGLLLHQPKQLLDKDGEGLFQALTSIQKKGLVTKIGISVYSPDELGKLLDKFTFDLVQIPYNVIDRRFLRTGWLSQLKQSGVEVHARSVFLQGLLLMDSSRRPQYFSRWDYLWEEWGNWLCEEKLSPLEACLTFVFSNADIDRVLVGVDSLNQLKEILSYSKPNIADFPPCLESNASELVHPSFWQKVK